MNASKLRRSLVWTTVLVAGGCGGAPTTPGPPPGGPWVTEPGPPLGPTQATVTVKDGWTLRPVAGALVSAGEHNGVTDSEGTIPLVVDRPACLTMTVRAAGFLERRTCAFGEVTLWPVIDAAEEAATRVGAYFNDRRAGAYTGPVEIVLAPELRARDEIVRVWNSAVEEAARLMNSAVKIVIVDRFTEEQGWEVALATSRPPCNHPRRMDPSIVGFCFEQTTVYFVDRIHVAPSLVDRRDVAVRATLAALVLSPHPQPGLLNAVHPAAEVSPFEQKTLHMLALRWAKRGVWPDLDVP